MCEQVERRNLCRTSVLVALRNPQTSVTFDFHSFHSSLETEQLAECGCLAGRHHMVGECHVAVPEPVQEGSLGSAQRSEKS